MDITEGTKIGVSIGVVGSILTGLWYVSTWIWDKVALSRKEIEADKIQTAEFRMEIRTTLNNLIAMVASQNASFHDLERRVLALEQRHHP